MSRGALKWQITALVLLLLAVAAVGVFFLERTFSHQRSLAALVNMSGMQRTLAHRIALGVYDLTTQPTAAQDAGWHSDLRATINRMRSAHMAMTQPNPVSGVRPPTSLALKRVYFDQPHELDKRVTAFVSNADRLLAEHSALPPGEAFSADTVALGNQIISEAREPLLFSLNAAVEQYVAEVVRAEQTAFRLLALTVLAAIILSGGGVALVGFATVRGLTRRVRELKSAQQKEEDANRLKSDFLATMSHEIRTPMNGILGMADLIVGAKPPAQIETYARTIIQSGETLLTLINDILDFSKIEAGRLELDPVPVDFRELIYDEAVLYSVKSREKAVEVVVDFLPGTRHMIIADGVRLRQVIGNLANNAIKFTEHGYVAITVSEDADTTPSEGNVALRVEVRDTGIGMSPEQQSRIFDKFAQADGSTTRKYGGTGLGLAICKQIVELMGGTIGVRSALGEGSTFYFIIEVPLDTQADRPPPPVVDRDTLKGARVLVVDDIELVRNLSQSILQHSGVHCDVVDNGKDAVRTLRDAAAAGTPYHLVLTDYLMPGMNGERLAREIKSHPELAEACLILMTASSAPFSDQEFVKKGFSAFFAKPIRSVQLVRALARVWGEYKGGRRHEFIRADLSSFTPRTGDDAPVKLPGRRVLVAEDNIVNQVFIQEILVEMEVELTVVANGQEAVDQVRENGPFDIVIMDCMMPVMDGYEATKAICHIKSEGVVAADMPILALTANAMKEDRERCINAGMDDYLTKPVRKATLKQKVYDLVGGPATTASTVSKPVTEAPAMDVAVEAVEASVDPTFIGPSEEPAMPEAPADARDQVSDAPAPTDRPSTATATGTGTENTPIIEEGAVASARAILKGKYGDMLKLFVTSSGERIAEMEAAVAARRADELTRPAHTLKSTAKQMGAVRLSNVAKDVEMMAKDLVKISDDGAIDEDAATLLLNKVEEAEVLLEKSASELNRLSA